MNPIEVFEICKDASNKGIPTELNNVIVPKLFCDGDYQLLWNDNSKKIRSLLDEIMCSEHPDLGLELLMRFGVFKALFPEISAMYHLGDDQKDLHKDVWEHTKAVVTGVPNTLELRYGALFHDVGKVKTRRFNAGRVTFHNHDRVGAKIVDSLNDRTKLFNDDVKLLRTVRALVMQHLRPANYNKNWTDSAVRRLITECGDVNFFQKLMYLSRSDLTTKNQKKRARCIRNGDELEARVKRVIEIDNAPKLPKGTMGIILEASGKKPGPWLNILRIKLEELMKDGSIGVNESVTFYIELGMTLLD
jgi:poly(A) polymerase